MVTAAYIFVIREWFWRAIGIVLVLQVDQGGPVNVQEVIMSCFCKRHSAKGQKKCTNLKQIVSIFYIHSVPALSYDAAALA